MENTKTIKIGNWTVCSSVFDGITLTEAKFKFDNIDSRRVEAAYYIANPKRKKAKRKD